MEKISVKIKRTDEPGLLHDSRADSRVLGKAVNILIDKVNELVDENNKLRKELDILKTQIPQHG